MNAELVRSLLLAGDEYERAADSVIIDKMVEVASSSSGLLDEEALVNALTSDLSEWKVGCEDNETTTFFDVWGFESYREKERGRRREASVREAENQEPKLLEAEVTSNDVEKAEMDLPASDLDKGVEHKKKSDLDRTVSVRPGRCQGRQL